MKTVLGILACVALVAACADKTPPREPSSATNTTSTETSTYSSTSSPQTQPQAQPQSVPTTMQPSPMTGSDAPLVDRGAPTAGTDPAVSSAAPTTTGGRNADAKNADNTKNNERDRYGTLTPGNQGNSSSETKITADIRKGLMSSKSLSFTAKNAKIITVGNKVTLRGAVKTDAEKAEIESVAKGTPGVGEVDNQLEVKK